jgi:hypothetical protein
MGVFMSGGPSNNTLKLKIKTLNRELVGIRNLIAEERNNAKIENINNELIANELVEYRKIINNFKIVSLRLISKIG